MQSCKQPANTGGEQHPQHWGRTAPTEWLGVGTLGSQVALPKSGLDTHSVTLDKLPAPLLLSVLIWNMGIVEVKVK